MPTPSHKQRTTECTDKMILLVNLISSPNASSSFKLVSWDTLLGVKIRNKWNSPYFSLLQNNLLGASNLSSFWIHAMFSFTTLQFLPKPIGFQCRRDLHYCQTYHIITQPNDFKSIANLCWIETLWYLGKNFINKLRITYSPTVNPWNQIESYQSKTIWHLNCQSVDLCCFVDLVSNSQICN